MNIKEWSDKAPACKYAHIKRDGWMILVRKNEAGRVRTFTKNFNEVDLSFLPEFAIILSRVPCGTEFYCELWKSGEHASYISSGIANRDKDMSLDVWCVSVGLPAQLPLPETMLEVQRWGLVFIPFLEHTPAVPGSGSTHPHPLSYGGYDDVPHLLRVLDIYKERDARRADAAGVGAGGDIEGFVLKNQNLGSSYKLKPFRTVDLVVTGVSWGNGKHAGKVGALICSFYPGASRVPREVANVSGMTDEERSIMTSASLRGTLIGRVVEVKYQKVNSQGRLRHATFVRFREDKGPLQCRSL